MELYYRVVDVITRGKITPFPPEQEVPLTNENEVLVGLLRDNEWAVARDVTEPEDFENMRQEYARGDWNKVILYRLSTTAAEEIIKFEEPGKGGTLVVIDKQLEDLVKKSILRKKAPE